MHSYRTYDGAFDTKQLRKSLAAKEEKKSFIFVENQTSIPTIVIIITITTTQGIP